MSAPPPDEPPRRYPQTFGGVVYLGVVSMAAVGIAIIVVGPWRTGVAWIGAALLVAALARSILSERGAGMLRVRRRWSDVMTLLIAGAALILLAVIVPDQPA